MRASIRTKLLLMCLGLVVIITVGTSTTYYILTRQDTQRESQERIQIAFDIIFDDLTQQQQFYTRQFSEFVQKNSMLEWTLFSYKDDVSNLSSPLFIVSYLGPFSAKLREFNAIVAARHLAVYAADRRLIAIHQQEDGEPITGAYLISSQGNPTFLSDAEITPLLGSRIIPDSPVPSSIAIAYSGTIPQSVSVEPFQDGRDIGFQVTVPIYRQEEFMGILVGEILYTQAIVERYAALSKTEVNFFAQDQLSIGTLEDESIFTTDHFEHSPACDTMMTRQELPPIALVVVASEKYYQGYCTFKNAQGDILGAVTVSLSQQVEQKELRAMLTAVFSISGIAALVALGFSVLFSNNALTTIRRLVHVIGAAAEGDLRPSVIAASNDEFGTLARRLNQMITQLRTISQQVQGSSAAVHGSADTILQQMNGLMHHMEEQTTSVDDTTAAVEKINRFIDTVAHNTAELLNNAALILSSIQQTRTNIREVTNSTGALTTNLQLISASVDQVNQSARQISDDSGTLEEIAQQTETEIRRIDESLRMVSQHAEQNQQSTQKTMEAVTRGQASVDASVKGMRELQNVVTNTAQIIREVNTWGEQVSSILDIVDDITGQTALLSLNASIISAQAGAHGRGFAVVADEIKELADRTKNSTKEIVTLVHALQKKTEEGVKNTEEGITKAEEGVQLATAVHEALQTIMEQASQSSQRAADTASMIQQTAGSSQIIGMSMKQVTEMVSHIRNALQEENLDIEQVVSAVENISGMAQQVSRASFEQQKSAEQIAFGMEEATERFSDISDQTETLRKEANQILNAMRTIETISEIIMQNATNISDDTVKSLVQHSNALESIVKVFKLS